MKQAILSKMEKKDVVSVVNNDVNVTKDYTAIVEYSVEVLKNYKT